MIGVLALQGAFIEHENMLRSLGVECREIRQKSDLEGIDGIILPGGESTVQGQLMRKTGIMTPLREMIKDGLPTFATCAGLILLAEEVEDEPETHLGVLPVKVRRNAYGRQLGSFRTTASVKGIGGFPMVFIRAPYISDPKDTEVLAEVGNRVVAARHKNIIAMAFHPELTGDGRMHESFLNDIRFASPRIAVLPTATDYKTRIARQVI